MRAKKAHTSMVPTATKAFLETSFCLPKPANNATRRSWLDKFGLLLGDETCCPKMDSLIKGELGKEALEADRKLLLLQNFQCCSTSGCSSRKVYGKEGTRPHCRHLSHPTGSLLLGECVSPILSQEMQLSLG